MNYAIENLEKQFTNDSDKNKKIQDEINAIKRCPQVTPTNT